MQGGIFEKNLKVTTLVATLVPLPPTILLPGDGAGGDSAGGVGAGGVGAG